MKNIYAEVQYIGTNYCGFQTQKNGISIQQELTDAIFKALNEKVDIVASGRTDSGVHALGQVINFHTDTRIKSENIAKVVNKYLPYDISINYTKQVSDDFNARFSAKKKTYIYKVCTEEPNIFEKPYCLYVAQPLDLEKIKVTIKKLQGEHDFAGFMATGSQVKDTVRKIYSATVCKEENMFIFKITGNGFLYNMVRIIMGTLLDVGMGKKQPQIIDEIIKTKDRKLAGKTVIPQGLCLEKVIY